MPAPRVMVSLPVPVLMVPPAAAAVTLRKPTEVVALRFSKLL
jgi:hypothetical protein